MRVLIVEDHALLGETLRVAMTARGIDVFVAGASGARILANAEEHRPHVVLLDLDLGSESPSGLDYIEPLRALGSRVLVLTGKTDRLAWAVAIERGAAGVISKTEPFDRLVAAVEEVDRTGAFGDPAERQLLLHELRVHDRERRRRLQPFDRLTPRESRVLAGLLAGKPPEIMAKEAHVSVATVRSQVQAVFRKLGVNTQLAAVTMAREAGWDPPP